MKTAKSTPMEALIASAGLDSGGRHPIYSARVSVMFCSIQNWVNSPITTIFSVHCERLPVILYITTYYMFAYIISNGHFFLQSTNLLSESKTYKINVVTKSREEITFIRLSPKAVQRAVEETFKNNINVSFFLP